MAASQSIVVLQANNTNDTRRDLEAQKTCSSSESIEELTISEENDDPGLQDNSNVPRLPLLKLFWFFFYNFGLFAWGGPVAQIALIKEKLVVKDKWITLTRFQRVFSVYQALPGPEATELCMFFGCLSAGQLGGFVAGIAFILPGFILMLTASYLYSLAGLENKYFNASFRAVQPVVGAMILRATHIIADHSVIDHSTRKIKPILVVVALCTALNSALHINMFISLGLYGIIYTFAAHGMWIIAVISFVLQYVVYGIYVHFYGVPSPMSLALGIAKTPSLTHLFVLGLVTGCISFGGAYTAIPLIQVEAVLRGGWLPVHVFLDCIAISNVLPAPLTIFATFVGFQGGLAAGGLGNAFAGAILITLGILAPCFIFTIAGHELLEKLVRNKLLSHFFDGLCAAVIGVITVIAIQMLQSSVRGTHNVSSPDTSLSDSLQSPLAAVIYMLALGALYKFTNKYTPLLLVVVGAIAGQFLFF
ncbi:chromate transport protein, putative [Talaromyces stipitatus ATCC 10500]|uniref:Chromate transport protein, putative n=1 Tax=Talaromyces stipitatus (strain ATCC 10500 / CBS 375.48 / QM 6759 / NRRL 1006) TaxID=441959 RepID=B8LWW3_TALSN|nr:chromate transport protein, putative [Talaromyces stipitatus ATCC 10500]EED24596.1 chromate transport protein, putative [Talaromyces stipitatus ATCC 10500]